MLLAHGKLQSQETQLSPSSTWNSTTPTVTLRLFTPEPSSTAKTRSGLCISKHLRLVYTSSYSKFYSKYLVSHLPTTNQEQTCKSDIFHYDLDNKSHFNKYSYAHYLTKHKGHLQKKKSNLYKNLPFNAA